MPRISSSADSAEAAGFDRQRHHVGRNLDMHRAGTAGEQDREGALDYGRQVRRVEQRMGVERQRLHHALLIRQFMQQAAAMAERISPVDA